MKYVIFAAVFISVVVYAQTTSESKTEQECERFVSAYVKGLETGEAAGGNSNKLALNKNEINSLKETMKACELKSEIMQKNHNAQQ